jgi:hypothetical protein
LLDLVRILVALSVFWTAIALGFQVVVARGGGRRDYARPAGSPARGIAYIFTVAMTPAHKETIRRHPVKFAIGLVMHIGVILVLLGVVVVVVSPPAGFRVLPFTLPIVGLALPAGVYLFIRRIVSADLRAMSVMDDYVAIVASCGLLVLVLLCPLGAQPQLAFLIYAGLLFVYLPLGKLRHAVFFFIARGDYGRRLGHRGVYPPSTASVE